MKSLCLFAAALPLAAIAAGGILAGAGTEDSPYEIEDYDDLLAFSTKANDGEEGAWAKLMNDIDATGRTDWE